MRPKLLITGTSGFLGGALARELESDFEIDAIPGRQGFAEQLSRRGGEPVPSAIVHAGFDVDFRPRAPHGKESESLANTRMLVDFAADRGVEHFVFLSGAGVLGVAERPHARGEEHVGETDPGFEAYRNTRYIDEKIRCEPIIAKARLPVSSVLYLTTVYGRGMPEGTRRSLLGVRGANPLVISPPGGTSYLGLDDFVNGIRRVLELRPSGRLTLSSGNVPFTRLYRTAIEVLGVGHRKRVVRLPPATRDFVVRVAGRSDPATAAIAASTFGYKYYSAERARREIGFAPTPSLARILAPALLDAAPGASGGATTARG